MAAAYNVRGYLTYLARSGCSGCTAFSQRVLPSLRNALPPDVAFTQITQPSYKNIGSPLEGYSALSEGRPVAAFPMLAWSCQPPETATYFQYLQAEKMGSAANIAEWVNNRLTENVCPTTSYIPQYEQAVQQEPTYVPPSEPSLFYTGQQGRQMFDRGYY